MAESPSYSIYRPVPGSYWDRRGFTFGAMESMIRPFVSVTSLSRPRPRSGPPEVVPEVFLEWGGPSQFAVSDFRSDARTLGFRLKDDDEDEEEGPPVYEYNGGPGAYVDYRVENPEDPNVYAIVRQYSAMVFSGPAGTFVLNMGIDPLRPGIEQGSGTEPPDFEFP